MEENEQGVEVVDEKGEMSDDSVSKEYYVGSSVLDERGDGIIDKRKVYVGNISRNVSKDSLMRKFDKFGKIADIEMIGRYAYITYEEEEGAEEAIKQMHNEIVDGYQIICELHDPSKRYRRTYRRDGGPPLHDRRPSGKYRVIVHPLDNRCTWQELKDYGRHTGSVSFANVYFYGSKKIGLLEYYKEEDQKLALSQLANKSLNHKQVRVEQDNGQYGDLFALKPDKGYRENNYNRHDDHHRDYRHSDRYHSYNKHTSHSPLIYNRSRYDGHSSHRVTYPPPIIRSNGRSYRPQETSPSDQYKAQMKQISSRPNLPMETGSRHGYSSRDKNVDSVSRKAYPPDYQYNRYQERSYYTRPMDGVKSRGVDSYYSRDVGRQMDGSQYTSSGQEGVYVSPQYSRQRGVRDSKYSEDPYKYDYTEGHHHHHQYTERDTQRHHTFDRHRVNNDDNRYTERRERDTLLPHRPEPIRTSDRRMRSRSPPIRQIR